MSTNFEVQLFINFNPFPNQETMMEAIKPATEALWTIYGLPNHTSCKRIYENILSKKVVREEGEKIHKLGGMNALRANYYALMHFSPFTTATDDEIRHLPKHGKHRLFFFLKPRKKIKKNKR